MRHADWGVRSPRWDGIRSEEIEVCGTAVHYLSAGSGRDGPTHLLVHPMAAGASMFLDLIDPLSALGPVVVPDLPGTLFGRTGLPHPRAARAEPNARFLRAFTDRLGIEGAVVHGWSMGGLVALLFADTAPDRVARLVLTCPTLPGPLPADEMLFWRFPAARRPDWERRIFPGAGHLLPLETPRGYTETVGRWLAASGRFDHRP
ncbi:alpha/beta fold hydrolase [Streptosporangium sp. NPDC050855]|uniref:alpha/beta fold hydrolase n=1 Tax=Streptosporangium sp. NPDC050855 TaxID=3366194 RepID=UPI0037A172DA